MTISTLAKKLKIKEGQALYIAKAKEEFFKNLLPLPMGVKLSKSARGKYDFILVFVKNKAELEKIVTKVCSLMNENASFWFCYPKQSSGIKSDLNRDIGWEIIKQHSLRGVAMISIDDTWSAFCAKKEIVENKRQSAKKTVIPQKFVDREKRIVNAPEDLKKLFSKNKKVEDYFNSLAFTHKREYVEYILEAKKEETRKNRVAKVLELLKKKKRNAFNK